MEYLIHSYGTDQAITKRVRSTDRRKMIPISFANGNLTTTFRVRGSSNNPPTDTVGFEVLCAKTHPGSPTALRRQRFDGVILSALISEHTPRHELEALTSYRWPRPVLESVAGCGSAAGAVSLKLLGPLHTRTELDVTGKSDATFDLACERKVV